MIASRERLFPILARPPQASIITSSMAEVAWAFARRGGCSRAGSG